MGSLIHSVHRPVKIFLPAILILVLLQYWIWQPPHWVHHLGPMLSQIHHHSHHSDHTHGQTTQSGESHQQQVDEECLALGCAGSRKFVAFQNSLPFFNHSRLKILGCLTQMKFLLFTMPSFSLRFPPGARRGTTASDPKHFLEDLSESGGHPKYL